MLLKKFFNRDALIVAQELLGKVIKVKYQSIWLSASIIETEAYYIEDKASHASLGYTEKRKALFMPAGTIYMYYARGGDSLNVSVKGKGNAILIKSGFPYLEGENIDEMLLHMQQLNPLRDNKRPFEKLCSGQTLLCKSLSLKVKDWDQKQFVANQFFIEDVAYYPEAIIQTKRLGIPKGRDENLPYRFIDSSMIKFCSK